MGSIGGSKHKDKSFDRILGNGISYLLMNLMSCCGFLRNIHSVVILKCPKSMLEYYFSRGFTILEYNDDNLETLPNDIKQRTRAEETDHSENFMTCINTIPSTSNTLKNLVVNKSLHSSYIQTEFNNKKKIIINIFSAYVVPMLKDINRTALLQEYKLNLDAASYEKILMITCLNLLIKNKLIVMIATCTGQPQ